VDEWAFLFLRQKSGKDRTIIFTKEKENKVKPNLFKEEFKCITKFPIT
jgi:hypothetical protein